MPPATDPNHNWGVGPQGSGLVLGAGVPPGGYYGQLMVNDLIPWVDKNFRTIADRDHRAMAGLSMGGRTTATVTMAHLDTFSHIGLLSGGAAAPRTPPERRVVGSGAPNSPTPPPTEQFDLKTSYNGAMAVPAEFNKRVKVLYFSCGGAEYPEGLTKHQQQLIDAGITNSYVYISPDTAHEWLTWRRSLYTYSQLLFR
jgi:enterochelin esterase family protein